VKVFDPHVPDIDVSRSRSVWEGLPLTCSDHYRCGIRMYDVLFAPVVREGLFGSDVYLVSEIA
jgi:hypothetical protein